VIVSYMEHVVMGKFAQKVLISSLKVILVCVFFLFPRSADSEEPVIRFSQWNDRRDAQLQRDAEFEPDGVPIPPAT